MKSSYKALKSGTDIRGAAMEAEGAEKAAQLTDEAVSDITSAFVFWLSAKLKKHSLKIAVGHDCRVTHGQICGVVLQRLKDSGCSIFMCGMCSTPSMFMMTKYPEIECDGAIMITASHHPYYMNGLKFFTGEGGINSDELSEILEFASLKKEILSGAYQLFEDDYLGMYCDVLKGLIRSEYNGADRPLTGLKIVVDAGNGVAGFFATRVLEELGADIEGSQYLDPDGMFPNHVPNPEDKTAINMLKYCVIDNKADLGIIFDADGDRVAVVTEDGKEINRNRLIALIGAILLENNPGAYIVTDSVTSDGLKEFIESRGGRHLRYKRGYRNVIDKAVSLCGQGENAVIAIETSGHAALRENYFLDDGAYLAVKLIIKAMQLKDEGKMLSDCISDLREPVEDGEARIALKSEKWREQAQRILGELSDYARINFYPAPDNYEGTRANIPDARGWFLVRLSVHDPVMPVNIESDLEGGVALIASELYSFFKSYEDIDLTQLAALI